MIMAQPGGPSAEIVAISLSKILSGWRPNKWDPGTINVPPFSLLIPFNIINTFDTAGLEIKPLLIKISSFIL